MKAAVYKGNGKIVLEDRPVPKILDENIYDAVDPGLAVPVISISSTVQYHGRSLTRSSGMNLSAESSRSEKR